MNKTLVTTNTVYYIIFSIGIIASVALIIAGLVAVAYILNIAMVALCQIATNIQSLYAHADSFVQLLVLCLLALLFCKLAGFCVRCIKKEVSAW